MATITMTLTIPDDVVAVIDAWRLRQNDPTGQPIYPTTQALLQHLLQQGLRPIILDAPPASIVAKQAALAAARAALEAALDSIIK
jgi:hypothetical protein